MNVLATHAVPVLERERLLARLRAWDDKKLILLHAQAGQGKSTLARAYRCSLAVPTAWYTFEAGDESLAVFLPRLGRLFHASFGELIGNVVPVPRSRDGSRIPDHVVVKWIADSLGRITRPVLIVFDDYQVVGSSAAIRSFVKLLLVSSPRTVRVLLLSRSRPALDIAGLRARGLVAELKGGELRFTDQEAQELFCQAFGMPVTDAEAGLINGISEGWAAGLVLMHEYLAAAPAPERLDVLSRRRSSEFRSNVFDYLAHEVFANLPPALQSFLLPSAVADRLDTSLLSALTGLPVQAADGRPSVTAVLSDLQARNLFISAQQDDLDSIRYHALFREFLLKKLHADRRSPEVGSYYAIAAKHFARRGDHLRSIRLWFAAGRADKAVREMEVSGRQLIAQGHAHTLLRWINSLPGATAERPWLLFFRAVACRYTDPVSALTWYDRAARTFRRTGDVAGEMFSLSGVIEACFHSGGDFSRMERTARHARTLLARPHRVSPEARARLMLAAGTAWFFLGKLRDGIGALQDALAYFLERQDELAQVTAAVYLAPCALYAGDFRLAREAIRKGNAAQTRIPDESGGRTALLLVQALTALFEGRFGEAQDCIDRCSDLAESYAFGSLKLLALTVAGWLKTAQNDYAGAVHLLKEGKRRGEESRNSFFSASAAHLLAIARMFQGDLVSAKRESDFALASQERSGSTLFNAIYRIASGAILAKLGKRSAAEQELQSAVRSLQRIGAAQQEANAHLQLAVIYRAFGRTARFRKHLAAGFGIGRNGGFNYYALLHRSELVELAEQAVSLEIEPDYCRNLLAEGTGNAAAPVLRIFCLGDFRVVRNGLPIREREWKSRLAKTLVKLLAVRERDKLTRDEVAEILWPDADPARKPKLLNSLLHRTRKILDLPPRVRSGRSCIVQEDGLLFLDPAMVWTDVAEFCRLSAVTGRKRFAGHVETAQELTLYDQAFSLYQGDFLPGDRYHDWFQSVRDHLRGLHLKMLAHAADLAESRMETAAALSYYEKIFILDPCDERACRWLMARYTARGERRDAIRIYERCQLALRRELDTEPEERTRQIFRSIIGE